MSAVPNFPPLQPSDCLVSRIEAIWGMPYSGPERRLSTQEWLGEVDRRVSPQRFPLPSDNPEWAAYRRDEERAFGCADGSDE